MKFFVEMYKERGFCWNRSGKFQELSRNFPAGKELWKEVFCWKVPRIFLWLKEVWKEVTNRTFPWVVFPGGLFFRIGLFPGGLFPDFFPEQSGGLFLDWTFSGPDFLQTGPSPDRTFSGPDFFRGRLSPDRTISRPDFFRAGLYFNLPFWSNICMPSARTE